MKGNVILLCWPEKIIHEKQTVILIPSEAVNCSLNICIPVFAIRRKTGRCTAWKFAEREFGFEVLTVRKVRRHFHFLFFRWLYRIKFNCTVTRTAVWRRTLLSLKLAGSVITYSLLEGL